MYSLVLQACGGSGNETTEVEDVMTNYQDKEGGADIIMVDGSLFSIPSPIESAMFIKENSKGFREDILLNPSSADLFATNSKKALALGVYGSDLGYVSLYEQDEKSLSYMGAARKLADDIGITGAFSENLVRRFSNNVGKPDSLVVLVSDIYKAGDEYLKSNDRNDVAALVLLGGWVESFYITCLEAQSGSSAFKKRIAEQKNGLMRLKDMLDNYPDNSSIQELSPMINKLADDFSKVSSTYVFKRPEVINAEQKTILKSQTEHDISESTLADIIEHTLALRTQITQN
jgi:hypothetical protein